MKSNDKNFINRLQRQKEDALEFVVDTYLPLIKGITYKVLFPLENDGVIEECINDIFLSIWNNSNKFHGDSVILKNGFLRSLSLKQLIITERQVRKWNLVQIIWI